VNEIYKVVIAPAASDRMAEHFEFLARVSEEAANNLLEKLIDDINSLQTLPFRNPVFDRPFVTPQKYRYMLSNKRYRIVYQVMDDTVFVDDIQDCRQDNDKNLVSGSFYSEKNQLELASRIKDVESKKNISTNEIIEVDDE